MWLLISFFLASELAFEGCAVAEVFLIRPSKLILFGSRSIRPVFLNPLMTVWTFKLSSYTLANNGANSSIFIFRPQLSILHLCTYAFLPAAFKGWKTATSRGWRRCVGLLSATSSIPLFSQKSFTLFLCLTFQEAHGCIKRERAHAEVNSGHKKKRLCKV